MRSFAPLFLCPIAFTAAFQGPAILGRTRNGAAVQARQPFFRTPAQPIVLFAIPEETQNLWDKTKEVQEDVKDKLQKNTAAAEERAKDLVDGVKDGVGNAADKAKGVTEQAKQSLAADGPGSSDYKQSLDELQAHTEEKTTIKPTEPRPDL